jgi:hypothetical protein
MINAGGFMARIKTIGISLKALSAKLRRLSLSSRIAGSGFLLAILSLNSCYGCAPTPSGGPEEIEVEKNGVVYVLKEAEIDNLRFEPRGLPHPIQPARAYWIRLGDKIAPLWDTHEWHWERKGAMCSFADNTSTDDCKICDWCNAPPNYADDEGPPPCMGAHPVYGSFDALLVVGKSGFIQDDIPQPIIPFGLPDYQSWRLSFFNNCSNRPVPFVQSIDDPLSFAPEASGLYSFRFYADGDDDGFKIRSETKGEIKIYVVAPGLSQKTAYQLDGRHSEDEPVLDSNGNPVLDSNGDPLVIKHEYWTWTMESNPLWLENFSQYLHVTDIRIFKGMCADGSAQGKQCAIPNESVPVRPSRILFLPNFQGTVSGHPLEDMRRCYNNNPAMGDFNFVNLASCRETCNANQMACTSTQISQKSPTPTYDSADYVPPMDGMPEMLPGRLTWLVEFNTSEGADADLTKPGNDAMAQDAVLIIEFTIKAKP